MSLHVASEHERPAGGKRAQCLHERFIVVVGDGGFEVPPELDVLDAAAGRSCSLVDRCARPLHGVGRDAALDDDPVADLARQTQRLGRRRTDQDPDRPRRPRQAQVVAAVTRLAPAPELLQRDHMVAQVAERRGMRAPSARCDPEE